MNLFYKHDWNEENQELTLYINQSIAFSEFASELLPERSTNLHTKQTLIEAAREYVSTNISTLKNIKTFRVKLQNFLVTVIQANPAERSSKLAEASLNDDDFSIYLVEQEEKLSDIASLLNIKVSTLLKFNEINEGLINKGTKLKVPVYFHTVVASDSLQRIAQKYDVTKSSIRILNQMPTDCLSPGQQIVIPKPL